jgi:PAS domain S-box-containing protein
MGRGSEWEHGAEQGPIPGQAYEEGMLAVADMAFTIDDEGIIQTVADPAERTLGYQSGKLEGKPVASLLVSDLQRTDPYDRTTQEGLTTALVDGRSESVVVPLETADGSVAPVSITAVSQPDGSGTVCFGQDVSPHLSTAQRPQSQKSVLDSVADPVYVLDAENRFERVNEALVEYTGYEASDLVRRSIAEIMPASSFDNASTRLEEFVEAGETTGTFEMAFITEDGSRILAEAHVTVETDETGQYDGSVAVLRDIRERKHRERNLDLLKEVLARVFRHNVRNELMVVQGHAEHLRGAVDERLQNYPDKILDATDRLLGHSEKARQIEDVVEADEMAEIDLASGVKRAVANVREEYTDTDIEVSVPDSAVVEAHPKIGNAIEELITNAIEHAPAATTASVDVWVDSRDGGQTLFVEDESGGLADHEIEILERGQESDLEHSSGVGLWLIRWLVEYSDAEMIVHRTSEGSLMGLRFGVDSAGTDAGFDDSPLGRAPAHVREITPERFRGETVIGREESLDRLDERYELLERTGGHSVLVTGEAGIGKTTLVEQFRDRILDRDPNAVIAAGVCDSDTQQTYEGFREVIDELPGQQTFADILADFASPQSGDPEEMTQGRQEFFERIAEELRGVATDHPVVLVVEDMHWADEGTVALFEYLVDEVGRWGHPVMFLGTYQTSTVAQSHPVLEIANETADAGRGTVIELEPFDTSRVRSLLSSLLDVETVPPAFTEAVSAHTGGTPLFVNELGRQAVDAVGPVQTGADLPDSLDEIDVPETVETAVSQRLESLPDDVWPALRVGAVIGRAFSFDLLREASDVPTNRLIEYSNTLIRRDIWAHSDDGISFAHGLVREQTLERIAVSERESLHATVATAIEHHHEERLGEWAGRLAYHYDNAGEYGLAFEYYQRAGEVAAEAYANDDAIEHYQRALELDSAHDVADDPARASLATELAGVYDRRGEYDRATEHYREALEIYRAVEDREGQGDILRRRGKVAVSQGDYDQAETHCTESLSLMREVGNSRGEARALDTLGQIAESRGNYDRAESYCEESLEINRAIGDQRGQADSLRQLGVVAQKRDDYDRAEHYHRKSLALYEAIDYPTGEAGELGNLGVVAQSRGDYEAAAKYYEECLERFEEIGDREGKGAVLGNLGVVAMNRGAHDRAREYYRESLEIMRSIGNRKKEANALRNLGVVAKSTGENETAIEYYEESLEIARELGDQYGEADSLHNLGEIKARIGDYERAKAYHEESLTRKRVLEYKQGQALSLQSLGKIAANRGAYDEAREHYERSLSLAEEIGNRRCQVIGRCDLGSLARRQGNLERARRLLTEALEDATEGEEAKWEQATLRELGAVARREGALDEARSHLQDALAVSDAGIHRHQRAKTNLERARVALAGGDAETAREAVETASETLSDLDAVHDQARATLVRGRLAVETDSPDEARTHYEQALETFEAVGAPQDALEVLEHLVDICREQGDESRATEYRSTAESIYRDAPDAVQQHGNWLDC